MPAIVVIGSIVMDVVVETPRIPASGENLHARSLRPVPGGKGANAAVAFVRMGGQAQLIANVGQDAFGEQIMAALARAGVDASGVGRVHDAPTGAGALLVEPDGQTAFIIAPGANLTLTPAQLEKRLTPILPRLHGLLFDFEVPEAALLRAAALARAANIPIFVDAGPARPYSPELWRHAAILSPNQPETEALVGFSIDGDEAAQDAAAQLLAQGPRAVALKLGARGALLATKEVMRFFPAFAIQAVDAAGAGDAFTAGLVWARLQGWAWEKSMRWANACGALAASRLGTMPALPTGKQVAAFLRNR